MSQVSSFCVLLVYERDSHVAQPGLEYTVNETDLDQVVMLLPWPPECWDSKCVNIDSSKVSFLFLIES